MSPDITDRTMLTPLPLSQSSAAANHAAVCAVLRWAVRAEADVADAGVVCAALGLDLDAALKEARQK